jgi:hypothetical protein
LFHLRAGFVAFAEQFLNERCVDTEESRDGRPCLLESSPGLSLLRLRDQAAKLVDQPALFTLEARPNAALGD